jgi:hypothetical protein
MVFVGRPIADIMDMNINQAALTGTLQNTTIEVRGINFGEERKDVELHAPILVASGMSDKRTGGDAGMRGLTPVCIRW